MWFHTFFWPSKHLQLAPFLGWPCMGCSTRSIMQLEMKKTPFLPPHLGNKCHFPTKVALSSPSPRPLCLPWMAWGFISYKICLLYSAFHYEHRTSTTRSGNLLQRFRNWHPKLSFCNRFVQVNRAHPTLVDFSSQSFLFANYVWLCFVLRKSFFPRFRYFAFSNFLRSEKKSMARKKNFRSKHFFQSGPTLSVRKLCLQSDK